MTYDLSFVNALSTGGSTFSPGFFPSDASVSFSQESVTVPAGGSASVTATINPATGPDLSQYGGYIVFTPQGGGQVYRVSYAGFIGDYQAIEAMTDGGVGFPFLGRATSCIRVVDGDCIGGTYSVHPDGSTFDMTNVFNQPSFLIHFDHQVRRIEMVVREASTGSRVHPVFSNVIEADYWLRNSTATSFFAFSWDGERMHNRGRGNDNTKTVPNGDYVVEVRVLKALGNPNNPNHWETWTSPVITIERPEAPRPGQGRGRR